MELVFSTIDAHDTRLMDTPAISDSIAPVARLLPFSVDDMEKVNEVFSRWHDNQNADDERLIALWTYCYVRRYFVYKFVRRSYGGVADMDALIEEAYKRISRGQDTIQEPDRYASWVSVVCRHTFLNYVRSWQQHVTLQPERQVAMPEHTKEKPHDVALLIQLLHQGIGRLPPSLQEVARLRLIQGCEYDEISRMTGKSASVVRSYFNKAIHRLREDAHLLEALQEFDDF